MRNSAIGQPEVPRHDDRRLARQLADQEHDAPRSSYAEAPTKLTLDPGQYIVREPLRRLPHDRRAAIISGRICCGVATTRDREWLTRFIVIPETVRASGDPIALALRAKAYKQVVDAEPGSRAGGRRRADRLHRQGKPRGRATPRATTGERPRLPRRSQREPDADRRALPADPAGVERRHGRGHQGRRAPASPTTPPRSERKAPRCRRRRRTCSRRPT